MSTKKRGTEEQDIWEEEAVDVCGSVASRRSTAENIVGNEAKSTGVVTLTVSAILFSIIIVI